MTRARRMIFDHIRPIMVVVILTLKLAYAEIVVPPEDIEALLGTAVTFKCSSSISGADVQWNRYPIRKGMEVLYAYGKIKPEYEDRFTVQEGHNLVISPVRMDDAGTYECQDDYGHGEKQSAELITLDGNPICLSFNNNITLSTCGIVPSHAFLYCSVQYQGNNAPALIWTKDGDEKPITSGVSDEKLGNRVWHNLVIKSDSIVNGSSYNCRIAKVASASVTCNSGSITIVDQSGEGTSPLEGASSSCQQDSVKSYSIAIICICILNLIVMIMLLYAVLTLLALFRRRMINRGQEDDL